MLPPLRAKPIVRLSSVLQRSHASTYAKEPHKPLLKTVCTEIQVASSPAIPARFQRRQIACHRLPSGADTMSNSLPPAPVPVHLLAPAILLARLARSQQAFATAHAPPHIFAGTVRTLAVWRFRFGVCTTRSETEHNARLRVAEAFEHETKLPGKRNGCPRRDRHRCPSPPPSVSKPQRRLT